MKASTSLNVRIERWCEMKKFKNFGYKQETILKDTSIPEFTAKGKKFVEYVLKWAYPVDYAEMVLTK